MGSDEETEKDGGEPQVDNEQGSSHDADYAPRPLDIEWR